MDYNAAKFLEPAVNFLSSSFNSRVLSLFSTSSFKDGDDFYFIFIYKIFIIKFIKIHEVHHYVHSFYNWVKY